MQLTSQTHKDLLAAGASMAVRATVGGVTYGMDRMTACEVQQAVMADSVPEVGACVSSMLSLEILDPDPIPRMADVVIEARLHADGAAGEWLPLGTFYIDTREYNHGGIVRLEAYDDMLKAEQPFADLFQGDQEWPIKMSAALQLISEAIGVPLDARNEIIDYDVGGPEDYSCRDVLSFIAAANAGNWIITPSRTLRLVPFRNSGEVAQDIGLAVNALDFGDPITIGRVDLYATEDSAYIVGDETGATYSIACTCPWATEQMAIDILAKLNGYVYQPYSADGAALDPAVELGDTIKVDGSAVPVSVVSWHLSGGWTADLHAPGEKEVDHEYPYKAPSKRQYERVIRKINATANDIEEAYTAAIKASQDKLESTFVKETIYTGDRASQEELIETLTTELRQTAAGLEVVAQKMTEESGYLDSLRLRLGFTTSGLTLNRSNEAVYILIDNDEAVFLKDEEDGTQTPIGKFSIDGLDTAQVVASIVKAATAELESSLSVGRFQWVDEGSLGFSLVRR